MHGMHVRYSGLISRLAPDAAFIFDLGAAAPSAIPACVVAGIAELMANKKIIVEVVSDII